LVYAHARGMRIREEHGRTLKAITSSLLWNYGMR
jgi:hypothetical protein